MGQRSRVPPARSARTGARTVTLFICGSPILLEECPSFHRFLREIRHGHRAVENHRELADARTELAQRRTAERIGCDGLQFERIEPASVVGDAIVEMR